MQRILKRVTRHGRISTWRLDPRIETTHISFKQKAQKLFSSSKVPSLGFFVKVDCPSVIQLGDPKPVNFRVKILPNRQFTSEDIYDVPQKAAIESLQLVVKSETKVLAPGSFSTCKFPISLQTSESTFANFTSVTRILMHQLIC